MELFLEKHIEITNGIRGGKPHLAGSRITVSDIVLWHFRQGYSLEEIAVKYDLSLAAVHAAISYYYDHKAEIDQEIEDGRAHYQRMKASSPSLLDQSIRPSDHA